jgi:hypothetical protein
MIYEARRVAGKSIELHRCINQTDTTTDTTTDTKKFLKLRIAPPKGLYVINLDARLLWLTFTV